MSEYLDVTALEGNKKHMMNSPSPPASVLIACASSGFRYQWREAIQETLNVHEADDFATLQHKLEKFQPILVLLDLGLPGAIGVDSIKEIQRSVPNIKIMVIVERPGNDTLISFLKAGAQGYCHRDIDTNLFKKAVMAVCQGEVWIERSLFGPILSELIMLTERSKGGDCSSSHSELSKLTPREMEVASLVGGGLSYKAIATKLCISENTVRNHLRHIFDKLGICDRLQLALMAHDYSITAS